MSPDTQAILLLCSTFGEGVPTIKPLTLREYNALAGWLVACGLRPADLLSVGDSHLNDIPLERDRIHVLLERGPALAIAMERWGQRGIWVIGRGDADYPIRLKRLLRNKAPAFFYGIGPRGLLLQGGLAVVGSRDADPETCEFVTQVARRCAEDGVVVVSGGARGVDETAMLAATASGGTSIGVASHGLSQTALSGKYRPALRDDRIVLMSAVHPDARFTAGSAMGRNKYIYALARAALVARSGTDGGTWTGAVECLRQRWVPVFVRPLEGPGIGNPALLEQGGQVWPANDPAFSIKDLLTRNSEPPDQEQLGLFRR